MQGILEVSDKIYCRAISADATAPTNDFWRGSDVILSYVMSVC
jgi:hypothetical protein